MFVRIKKFAPLDLNLLWRPDLSSPSNILFANNLEFISLHLMPSKSYSLKAGLINLAHDLLFVLFILLIFIFMIDILGDDWWVPAKWVLPSYVLTQPKKGSVGYRYIETQNSNLTES